MDNGVMFWTTMQLAIIKNSGYMQFAKMKLIRGSRSIAIPDGIERGISHLAIRYRVC